MHAPVRSTVLAAILAWRLSRPSQATVGVAILFAFYTILRIGLALPGMADAGVGYAPQARILCLAIFSSIGVAQLIVLPSLWHGGWFRGAALPERS